MDTPLATLRSSRSGALGPAAHDRIRPIASAPVGTGAACENDGLHWPRRDGSQACNRLGADARSACAAFVRHRSPSRVISQQRRGGRGTIAFDGIRSPGQLGAGDRIGDRAIVWIRLRAASSGLALSPNLKRPGAAIRTIALSSSSGLDSRDRVGDHAIASPLAPLRRACRVPRIAAVPAGAAGTAAWAGSALPAATGSWSPGRWCWRR